MVFSAASPESLSDMGEQSALGPVIEQSWKRSLACGLDQGVDYDLPYDQHFDDDSRLIRASRPILERLVTSLAGTRHGVVLADREARIIERWVGMKNLDRTFDNASVAPGFGFTEEFAGTNGVGTALEEAKIVVVRGHEHYADFLRNFSCVGMPIHHPITGRVEGIIDFTCLAKDFNQLIPPLLVEVAKHIETRLSQLSSAAEVALLERFVRTCRTNRGAVVAIRPNMFMTNDSAADHLAPTDQAVLWDAATTLASRGREEGSVDLARGQYRIRVATVDTGARTEPGLVIRLSPERGAVTTTGPRKLSAKGEGSGARLPLPGRSPQWNLIVKRAEAIASSGQPVAITGEAGTGKVWLARQIRHLSTTTAGMRLFDAAMEGRDDRAPLLARCRDALEFGDTVIVRRIDKLPASAIAELGELVRHGVTSGRLIVTCDDSAPESAERTLSAFPHTIWLPPLRRRAEDIADLIPSLLADLAAGRTTSTLPVVQVLMRYPWPGNTAELRDVLAGALVAAGHGDIELAHVPPWILKRAHRRQFTPIEQSERDLIIETLASVDNNRTEAAKILGIGRATLYRKLRSLGISTSHELAS